MSPRKTELGVPQISEIVLEPCGPIEEGDEALPASISFYPGSQALDEDQQWKDIPHKPQGAPSQSSAGSGGNRKERNMIKRKLWALIIIPVSVLIIISVAVLVTAIKNMGSASQLQVQFHSART